MTEEIGRELHIKDLRLNTVVALQKSPHGPAITCWVVGIGPCSAQFYMGEAKITLILERRADDTLHDDSGMQIHVYEYLGEV